MSANALAAAPRSPSTDADALARSLHGLDAASLWWLSGYAAALAHGAAPTAATQEDADDAPAAAVIYGSQTGNAHRIAEALAAELRDAGVAARLVSAGALRPADLAALSLALIVISTQGDGEPPEDARDFVEALAGRRAPRLDRLRYGVLALGDSSYPQFCATGRQVDARLAELGATRALPLAEADVDVDAIARPWRDRARTVAAQLLHATPRPGATVTPLHRTTPVARVDREHPGVARVLAKQPITDIGSSRAVHHLELSLPEGATYEPGDALGVWPRNPPATVEALIEALALDGDAAVTHAGESHSLRDWLSARREITRLHRDLIAAQAQRGDDAALRALLDDGDALRRHVESHQALDVLARARGQWDAASLVATLKPLAPRLYSIASSRADVGDEVHLTVAALDSAARPGAASTLLIGAGDDAELPVYVASNPSFRLPADGDRDLVMIAAGTGVAPFRAFMQQRVAVGARGRHWLLFGNRRLREDFLYQTEWQALRRGGQLHRLSAAFSRDGDGRIYVQQRLREEAHVLFEFIDRGAHLYVCGSLAMGRDVQATLLELFAQRHGGDRDAADEALRELRQQGRYARDLY